jgi:hypothetical protein
MVYKILKIGEPPLARQPPEPAQEDGDRCAAAVKTQALVFPCADCQEDGGRRE